MVRISIASAGFALLALAPSGELAADAKVECQTTAFMQYNAAKLKLAGIKVTPTGDPTVDDKIPIFSIDRTIAGRRLEEDYCLKVVVCKKRAGGTDMEDALNFIGCIDDEDKEHVLSNLHDGSDAERQEAITRLKDE